MQDSQEARKGKKGASHGGGVEGGSVRNRRSRWWGEEAGKQEKGNR